MFEQYDDILTPEDVSYALKIGMNSVYKLLNEGKLKGFRIGTRSWHIPKSSLIEYITENTRKPNKV